MMSVKVLVPLALVFVAFQVVAMGAMMAVAVGPGWGVLSFVGVVGMIASGVCASLAAWETKAS